MNAIAWRRIGPLLLTAGVLTFGIFLALAAQHAPGVAYASRPDRSPGNVSVQQAVTLTVTKLEDSADGVCDEDCSLREAVMAANTALTISAISIPTGLYRLTLAPSNIPEDPATGDLNLTLAETRTLMLSGAGADVSIIDANGIDRVLQVAGGQVVLQGLTLRNGSAATTGGGIAAYSAHLVLVNSHVSHNRARLGGGGIYVRDSGALSLTTSVISHNQTTDGAGRGGGILFGADGGYTIVNSQILSNSAAVAGGLRLNGDGVITASRIEYNQGGGLDHTDGSALEVRQSVIGYNVGYGFASRAVQSQVLVAGSTIHHNAEGVYVGNSLVTLLDSEISHNGGEGVPTGGIANAGWLTLSHTLVAYNRGEYTGGIANTGVLVVHDSTISTNTVRTGGAGIRNQATMTLTNSAIVGNISTEAEGSAILNDAQAVIAGAHVHRNQGTGIANRSFDAHTQIADSRIEANLESGIFNSGVMTLTGSLLDKNQSICVGAGIINWAGALLQIEKTTLRDNWVAPEGNEFCYGEGGGIYNLGLLTTTAVVMAGNQAVSGGGVYNSGTMTVRDSTFLQNRATERGGGLANYGGMDLTNVTISGNHAIPVDDSNPYVGIGGGIMNPAVLTATHVTLVGNRARQGGGIWQDSGSTAHLGLANSLLAHNEGGDCKVAEPFRSRSSSMPSMGNNLASDDTCQFGQAGDHNRIDPLVMALGDDGGETPTHALYANSPAIDAAAGAYCAGADQRETVRPQGPACDIGAYEWVTGSTPVAPTFQYLYLPITMK